MIISPLIPVLHTREEPFITQEPVMPIEVSEERKEKGKKRPLKCLVFAKKETGFISMK